MGTFISTPFKVGNIIEDRWHSSINNKFFRTKGIVISISENNLISSHGSLGLNYWHGPQGIILISEKPDTKFACAMYGVE